MSWRCVRKDLAHHHHWPGLPTGLALPSYWPDPALGSWMGLRETHLSV